MSSSDLPKYYLCTDFTEVVENFGRSDNDMIYLLKKFLFPINAYVVSCAKRSKNLERYLCNKPHKCNSHGGHFQKSS